MAELEKVIKGLECCLNTGNFEECTKNCPYFTKKFGVWVCFENVMRDALSLLKAQEPFEPVDKKEWIARLATRFSKTQCAKDFKALKNAEDRYEENIRELMQCGLPVYQPAAMDYDLIDYVHKARNDWCKEG